MKVVYLLGTVFGTGLASAIKAMAVACVLPFVWAILAKWLGGFKGNDNLNPRAFLATLDGLPARANAVQVNSFESLPMFLAGVFLAIYCFVPQTIVNGYAWAYVGLRIIYGVAYLYNWATLRSIIWGLSMVCIAMLFMMSLKMVGAS